MVRTTINLPDDVHRQALALARDTSRSLSETVADLLRRALAEGRPAKLATSARTGLPVIHLGTTITSEDVFSLEDDE